MINKKLICELIGKIYRKKRTITIKEYVRNTAFKKKIYLKIY